jgi:hypothetical protein
MKVNLAVKYVVLGALRKDDAFKTDAKITHTVIVNAVESKFSIAKPSGGVKEKRDQRFWTRISDILVNAANEEEDTVEMSKEQVEWILDVFKEYSAPQALVSYTWKLRSYLKGLVGWKRDADDDDEVCDEAPAAKNGTKAEAPAKV